MTQPTTADAARSYLANKSCTLWSEFDISDPTDPRFDAAVSWLTAQVQAVNAERRRMHTLTPDTHAQAFVYSPSPGQQPERFTDEYQYETD